MDYKKTKAPSTTQTRDITDFDKDTENIYKSLTIISKRSNQIALELKDELRKKLDEFASYTDNLEEVFENREQIEISRFYEKLPNATLIALDEFLNDKVTYRTPEEEEVKEA